jgi:hypothetical protein
MITANGEFIAERMRRWGFRGGLPFRVAISGTGGKLHRSASMLPEHLGYVSKKLVKEKKCRKNRALASLSYAYLATKRLTTLQLGTALCYSLLSAALRKMISSSRINLKKTVKMYSICMQSKLRQNWPFESVEHFCESLCDSAQPALNYAKFLFLLEADFETQFSALCGENFTCLV